MPADSLTVADGSPDAFSRAVDHNPQLDRAWYGLGLALIRLGRHAEAIAAFKRNTELQPMSPYGWYQMARAHMDLQQPEEAARILRHLRGFEPKVAAQLERETGLGAAAAGTQAAGILSLGPSRTALEATHGSRGR